jgi:glycosyltransferase involved in cell wall biosynthesis
MMQKDMPLVSVGLPIYNRPEGLRRTLECFVNQTYVNIEIIIADNCSPDPEVEKIAREYAAKDDRISYFRHEENKGWGYNTNFVIEKAKGEYFLRATDDDWWDVTFIEKIMNLMLNDSKAVLGYSNFIEVDHNFEKSRYHIDDHLPLLQEFTGPSAVKNVCKYVNQFEGFGKSDIYFSIFKTSLLRAPFVFNTLKNQVLAGDLLIVLDCLSRGTFVVVPEVLMKVSFGNEKHYEMAQSKSKKIDFLFATFDYQNFIDVRKKWIHYFKMQFSIVSKSDFKFFEQLKIKAIIRRRIIYFYYDLICVNSRIRYFNIFNKLKRKYYLE